MSELSPAKQVLALFDSQQESITQACSGGVSFEAIRSALGAAMIRTPDIVECTSPSILMACICAAKLGIDPESKDDADWKRAVEAVNENADLVAWVGGAS